MNLYFRTLTIFLMFVSGFFHADTCLASRVVELRVDRSISAIDVPLNFTVISPNPSKSALFKWDFGDGEVVSTSEETTTHAFTRVGKFEVTVEIQDGSSVDKASIEIEIVKNEKPKAEFYFKNKLIDVGVSVAFVSQADDEDQAISKIEWSVNTRPMMTGTGPYFEAKFASAGKFEVTQKVFDSLGAFSTITKKIEVRDRNILPRVRFTRALDVAGVGEPFDVEVEAADPDGKIVSVFWTIGTAPEMETGELQKDVWLPTRGSHLISVRVVDDRGGSSVVRHKVYAKDRARVPKVSIEASARRVAPKSDVVFSVAIDHGVAELQQIEWDFGDGRSKKTKDISVSHAFVKAGKFVVTAQLTFLNGVETAVKTEVEVNLPRRILTSPPTQVVINDYNYIEVIPTQKITLNFSAYDDTTEMMIYPTPVWTLNNSHVSIFATSGNTVTLQGVSAGETSVTVSIDGVQSQVIAVKVLDFVGSAVVTQRGRFLGSRRSELCTFVDSLTTGGFWTFEHDLWSGATTTSYGEGSDKVGNCGMVNFPLGIFNFTFSATKSATTYSYTKTGINIFEGRSGFLVSGDFDYNGANFLLQYADDRLIKFDGDFSITMWRRKSNVGKDISLEFKGDAEVVLDSNGGITATANGASTKALFGPKASRLNGKWHHVAATFVASTRELKYFFDGEFIGSLIVPTGTPYTQRYVRVTGSSGFNGSTALDDLRFWNKALSGTEISGELFSPVAVTDTSLLAAFSFDTGYKPTYFSDNGSGWSLRPVSVGLGYEPRVNYTPSQIFDANLTTGTRYHFSQKIPYSEYGRSKLEVTFDSTDLASNQRLTTAVSYCVEDCFGPVESSSVLRSKRLGPVFHFRVMESLSGPVTANLPFDAEGVSPAESRRIKVLLWTSNNSYPDHIVLEPLEVNLAEGFVKVDLNLSSELGGAYWVGIPTDHHLRESQYANSDLLPYFESTFGRRIYYTQVPNSVSTYTLDRSAGSAPVSSVYCYANARMNVDITFPFVVPDQSAPAASLVVGYNVCDVYYRFFPYSADEYESYDRFYIYRGSP